MNEIFELTPAETDADFALIRELAEAVWYGVYGNILTREQSEYMIEMMYALDVLRKETREEGVKYFIARENGVSVGFTSWGGFRSGEAKIHKLYLREKARGRGYGRKMLDFDCAQAAAAGFKSVRLNVNRENTNSVAVYKACGFEQAEAVDVPIGGGFYMNDFVMKKKLTG